MEIDWGHLPCEVVCEILSHLLPLQRLSAGLVCKRWLQAADMFLKDFQWNVGRRRPGDDKCWDRFPAPATDRMFPQIAIFGQEIDESYIYLLQRLGPSLLKLRFVDCSMRLHFQRELIDCPLLRTLETNVGKALLLFKPLPQLVELNLKKAGDATDKILMAFDKIAAQNLEVFTLPCSNIAYEEVGPFLFGNAFDNNLSYAAIRAFVARRAASLATLHLPKSITRHEAACLSNLGGLQLRSVSFCSGVDVFEFCRNQLSLVEVDIFRLGKNVLTEQQIAEICRLLPSLQTFSLRRCPPVGPDLRPPRDRGIAALFKLPRLRVLRLPYYNTTPASLNEAIPTSPMLQLRILNLSYTKIEEDQIQALLSQTPQLEELHLSGCEVHHLTLEHVWPLLPRLRTLVLNNSQSISYRSLRAMCDLRLLEVLKLDGTPHLTSRDVEKFIRFPYLKELSLNSCPFVSNDVRRLLKAHNPCLATIFMDPKKKSY